PLLAFSTASIASARKQFAMRNRNGSRGFGNVGAVVVLVSVVALMEANDSRLGIRWNARHLRLRRRAPSTGISGDKSELGPVRLRLVAAAGKVAPTRDLAASCSRIGASPSGKAADFDSAIRRFESSRPSHATATACRPFDRGEAVWPTNLLRPIFPPGSIGCRGTVSIGW